MVGLAGAARRVVPGEPAGERPGAVTAGRGAGSGADLEAGRDGDAAVPWAEAGAGAGAGAVEGWGCVANGENGWPLGGTCGAGFGGAVTGPKGLEMDLPTDGRGAGWGAGRDEGASAAPVSNTAQPPSLSLRGFDGGLTAGMLGEGAVLKVKSASNRSSSSLSELCGQI